MAARLGLVSRTSGLRLHGVSFSTRGASRALTHAVNTWQCHRLHSHGLAAVAPTSRHAYLQSSSPWLSGLRWAASDTRLEGIVKMWNEQKGFGFIAPDDGSEDLFLHRSGLPEGVIPEPGSTVTYVSSWDDRKQKYRAASVQVKEAAPSGSGDTAPRERPERKPPIMARQERERMAKNPPTPPEPAKAHHMVADADKWAITKEPMAADESDSTRLRHRIKVRESATKSKDNSSLRQEEFQIVGDASWNKRYYPGGGIKEEVIVIRPGDAPSKALYEGTKGHGRNWAVEGKPGTTFDIIFDTNEQAVSCEEAFVESK